MREGIKEDSEGLCVNNILSRAALGENALLSPMMPSVPARMLERGILSSGICLRMKIHS